MMEYTAVIKEIEDGWYMAQCEQVPGALTQGRTVEEALENLKEAIILVLETERDLCRERYKDEKTIHRAVAVW
jgi:predicted RNase H-like HicB family nuclease